MSASPLPPTPPTPPTVKTTYIMVPVEHHAKLPADMVLRRMQELLPAFFSIGTSTAHVGDPEVYAD